jgi:hypothetical protein
MPYIFGVYAKEKNAYQRSSQSEGTKKFSHNKSEKENGECKREFLMKIGTDFHQIPIEFYLVLSQIIGSLSTTYVRIRTPRGAIINFLKIMSSPASEQTCLHI